MIIIDNLKDLFTKKENRNYLLLIIWLLVGFSFIQFLPLIGVFIFLPFLTYTFFLFLNTMIFSSDIRHYSIKKMTLYFVLSLPLVAILSLVFIALFIYAILSYIFFTSWFTLYGCYLVGKKVDRKLLNYPFTSVTRGSVFIGGFILSLILLFGFFTGTLIITIYTRSIPFVINIVFIIIGIVIVAFFGISTYYLFKKIYTGWLGIFFILVTFYTFFLVFKVILGLASGGSTGTTSPLVRYGLLAVDIFILLYSISTILGSQAELISEKFKLFSVDRALIWLIFSKGAYEFAANFPYDLLSNIPLSFIDFVIVVGNELNLIKNIAVLALFVILVIVIGLYQIIKYVRFQKDLKKEVEEDVKEKLKIKGPKTEDDIYYSEEDFEDVDERDRVWIDYEESENSEDND